MLVLSGCAFNQRQVNNLADQLRNSPPESTLVALNKLNPPARDHAQFLLDRGTLELLSGDFAASIASLESAKSLLNALQAISVSENIGAITINETLRAYAGTPGERVMLQQVQAINYLMQGNLDGARVEALQANVLMNQVADDQLLRGQLASARFVAGLVYELGGEWSDAMISYRKAAEVMQRRRQPLPRALEDSLLRASKKVGLSNDYTQYVQTFGRHATVPKAGEGELIVIYWDGVVTSKHQRFISVYVPELGHNVTLALPYYPPANYHPRHLAVDVQGHLTSTEMIEDVEALARQGLDAQSVAIYTAALARIASKHQAVKAAQQQNENSLAAFAANLAAIFSEIADTRSWNMLPSTIQVARVIGPAGDWQVRIPNRGGGSVSSQLVSVSAGQKLLVLAPQTCQRLFTDYTVTTEGD